MRIVSFVIAVAVALGLYLLIMERGTVLAVAGVEPSAETATEEAGTDLAETVPVVAVHSQAVAVSDLVLVRGRTEAARQVSVMAETAGRVISEPLRKGARVDAGDMLCELDPGTREAALAEARARLAEAEINDNAAQRLRQEGYASESRAASAGAAIEAARAGVAAAEREIERLSIRAPFAGLLETDAAELGALLQPGSLCATVIQLDPIKLVGFLPETEVAKVEANARAGARLATGAEVTGNVTFIGRSADPATRTFRVEVEIPNADMSIRDGQTVEMVLASGDRSAHLVPQSALTLNDAGEIGVRIVGDGNQALFVPVTVLRDSIQGVWLAGLPETADIITIGQEYVSDGVPVQPSFNGAAQ
ncbi:efflux RND transporter periplasmic adaptor subunit [Actibacterium sp. XHP0104]|uniref:efflux RND transporter periplasmic adaptor subunit n=1 Tax=Actibacterium sp. XHP0104 TaxID=2984335 RepID=UPI0021E85EEE|nr:efflux RND transporter periplasmic adaptor subunit [Actibacterium sp. XHP0104]MCV2881539.1 efflux RND transporter periplasmic adaptor subunit [Actibacterium sp. XHP0104]